MTIKINLHQKPMLAVLVAVPLLLTAGYSFAHSGPLNKFAVDACDQKARSQSCQYEGGHNDLYIGTCQIIAKEMMCVRNKPIQKVDPSLPDSEDGHTHDDAPEAPKS